MDTVQSVSKSLKLVSCALTSMRWLDIIKKLIAAAAIATAACSALSIIALRLVFVFLRCLTALSAEESD